MLASTGSLSRMDLIKQNVKNFLQKLQISETESSENTIVNVIRFGTKSEILTPPGQLNTRSKVDNFLNTDFETKIVPTDLNFSAYENYDLAFEDVLTCVRKNKTINSKPNVIIFITDGNKAYNTPYCQEHNGDMSEYANKLINGEGATIYAVGINSNNDVLSSMVLNNSDYYRQIDETHTLTDLLNNIEQTITQNVSVKDSCIVTVNKAPTPPPEVPKDNTVTTEPLPDTGSIKILLISLFSLGIFIFVLLKINKRYKEI